MLPALALDQREADALLLGEAVAVLGLLVRRDAGVDRRPRWGAYVGLRHVVCSCMGSVVVQSTARRGRNGRNPPRAAAGGRRGRSPPRPAAWGKPGGARSNTPTSASRMVPRPPDGPAALVEAR